MSNKNRKTRRSERKQPPSTQEVRRVDPGTPLTEEQAAQVQEELSAERSRLDALRAELDGYRSTLRGELELLATRETALDTREDAIEADQLRIDAARAEVERGAAALSERVRAIVEREADADAGFAQRNAQALAALEQRLDDVRQAISRADADLATRRLTAHEQLDAELRRERTERLAAIDEESSQRRSAAEKELAAARQRAQTTMTAEQAEHDARISQARSELEKERARLDEQQRALEAGRAEVRRRETAVELEKKLLEADHHALEDTIAGRVAAAVTERQRRIETLEAELRDYSTGYTRLENRLRKLQEEQAMLGDRPADEVLAEVRELRDRRRELEEQLRTRPGPELQQRYEALLADQRGWQRREVDLVREVGELRSLRHQWLLGAGELEQQRDLADMARRSREVLVAQSERLESEVQRLRELYVQPAEKAARVGVIEEPLITGVRRGDIASEELAWLKEVHDGCSSVGMAFPERLLQSFHTSLKCAEWSSLTVLAGVSGTGKSEMPRLYAHFGGIAYLPLAVEPNWDSPQSLVGFFNAIDNRFNAKPLLRALVQSQSDRHPDGLADRMLLVLLDEMNLAHVELYFSDFLSKLEDRRGRPEGETRLGIDLGAGMDPYPLPLGRNVLWTGTMNEDATTRSLSDKVIDRANVLVFPRPRAFQRRGRPELPTPATLLARSTWDRWLQPAPLTEDQVSPYKTWLEEVNGRLEAVGRALGHRVWQSVEAYMSAHPRVLEAVARDDADARRRALSAAFEDAVVQKVMPKLRGIETSGTARRDCLDPIQKLLADAKVGLNLADDFKHALAVGHGAFQWSSAHYLESGA